MALKLIDTRDSWKDRGYKIVPNEEPYALDPQTKENLYTWGQVVPLEYNLKTGRNKKK